MKRTSMIVGGIGAVLLLGIFLVCTLISGGPEENASETYVTECPSQEEVSVSDNDSKDMETYLYVDETAEVWRVFSWPEWPYEYEEIPYADEDTFKTIMAAYEDIDYLGESIPASEEDYEEGLKNFARLIRNEIPFLDSETGEKMYVQESKDFGQLHEHEWWRYFLWDINGDGTLEACMRTGNLLSGLEYIFEYDSELDEYVMWKYGHQKGNSYVRGDYVGNGGSMWFPGYDSIIQEFIRMDPEGEPVFRSFFFAVREPSYHSKHSEYIYMAMIPWYAEREKEIIVTEDMKQQGIFEKKSGQWYFRITEEQFKELEEPYMNAFWTANKKLMEDWMTYEELMNAVDVYEDIPQIINAIVGAESSTALCEDGSVWQWENESGQASAKKVEELSHITKIMEVGNMGIRAFYALSEEGDVYAWGSNRSGLVDSSQGTVEQYEKPIRFGGLANIVEMDAKDDHGFAVDNDGRFYQWGVEIYNYADPSEDDYYPSFPEEHRELVEGVTKVFAGAGDYSYFIREDGSVFSIMEKDIWSHSRVYPYILPVFEGERKRDYRYVDWVCDVEGVVRLDQYSKFGTTCFYELGKLESIDLIGADAYTVFVYDREQNTLSYWDSKRVAYHDDELALVSAETYREDYSGRAVEINFMGVLEVKGEESAVQITDICAGKENVLFLTNSGEVFMSEYVTERTEDVVEYYRRGSSPPGWITTAENLEIKTLSFCKLGGVEHVISINTDGKGRFTAVNQEGEVFLLDMTVPENREFQRVD